MKVLYDTCLYIDLLRSEKRMSLFESRFHIRFLSPIVIMELNAGASTSTHKRALQELYYPYSRAGRILSLSTSHYYKAGEVLMRVKKTTGTVKKGFSHDILVALSASTIGATLFTSNQTDFELIKRFVPLKLEIV